MGLSAFLCDALSMWNCISFVVPIKKNEVKHIVFVEAEGSALAAQFQLGQPRVCKARRSLDKDAQLLVKPLQSFPAVVAVSVAFNFAAGGSFVVLEALGVFAQILEGT